MPSNTVEAPAASSNADFHSLEEKILKTIELLEGGACGQGHSRTRRCPPARAIDASAKKNLTHIRAELVALRKEREEVRTRVEKMLGQIETLTAEE